MMSDTAQTANNASAKNPLAWVTGASTGIGAATAIALAQQGWDVIITARSHDKLANMGKLASEFKGRIIPLQGDVTDKDAMQALVADIETRYGPIDMAVLNAGSYISENLDTFKSDDFISQVSLNLFGTVFCVEALLPRFISRHKGHIAIVSSVAGYRGLPHSLGYGSSKAALINFAESLAIMGKAYGIKVQIINPGFVRTPLTAKNKFKMPFLIDAGEAAKRITDGLKTNRFEIAFPRRFAFLLKLLGLLPDRMYQAIARKATKA
ncbi:MAG: SDR family NAD(P)-dependent oxidoreductase [Micavibrio sp.]|nr:SDR family NAD(P)-dependent oxidoreductase [Micavibrio sp.]